MSYDEHSDTTHSPPMPKSTPYLTLALKTVSTSALKGSRRTRVKAQVNSAARVAQLVQSWPNSHSAPGSIPSIT